MEQPKVAMLSSDNKFRLGELAFALESVGTRIITFGKTARVLQSAGVQLQETGVLEAQIGASIFLNDEHSRHGIARVLMQRITNSIEDLEKNGLSPIDFIYVNLIPPKYDEQLDRVLPDAVGVNYILQGMLAGRTVMTEPSTIGLVIEQLAGGEGFSSELRQVLAYHAASHVERHMHQCMTQLPVPVTSN